MWSIKKAPGLLLLIAYIGFVSLGLPDTLVGLAWPSVRDTFSLHQSSLGLVFIGGGCGYFLSSFFTGRLLNIVGVGILLAASSVLVAISGFGFSLAPLWAVFVACSVLHGVGSGAIDAGLNNYVANHFSARHMNWLHACYNVGATGGSLIMTAVLARNSSWRSGYAIVAGFMLLLSLLFTATRSHWGAGSAPPKLDEDAKDRATSMAAALSHPTVLLQTALFFFYTGLEVTIGQWSFTLLTESRHIDKQTAGLWVTIYWASIGVGRVLFGFLVNRIGIDRLLRFSTITAVVGTILVALADRPPLIIVGITLVGLALAPIYPCMMTRTPQRVGRSLGAHAIGFQVAAAMLGAAALPSAAGLLGQYAGLESIWGAAAGMALALWMLHEIILRRMARVTEGLRDAARNS